MRVTSTQGNTTHVSCPGKISSSRRPIHTKHQHGLPTQSLSLSLSHTHTHTLVSIDNIVRTSQIVNFMRVTVKVSDHCCTVVTRVTTLVAK